MTEEVKQPEVGPLSHSSAKTLTACEQKYVFYKVQSAPKDPDYVKSDALAVGSAFHWILENSLHEKPKNIVESLDHCEKDVDILLPKSQRCLVHAMVLYYRRLHVKMGFKVIYVELGIKTKDTIGYIDAIMEGPDGRWWIVDLKALASFYMPTINSLFMDPQLNLYAAHASLIAKELGLDPKRFGGCRWRVVTKSKANQRELEDDVSFVKRLMASSAIKAHDIEVPIELMAPKETLARHKELYKVSKKLYKPGAKPAKNFDNCFKFNKPCEYYSRCHGHTYSEAQIAIVTEE